MKSNNRAVFVALPATALFLAACGGGKVVVVPNPTNPQPAAFVTPAAPASVVVSTVPATPLPPNEIVQGVSPGSSYVWVAGYYDWRGDRYEWVPGAWLRNPTPTAVWAPGYWQPTTGGYIWVAGHWR